MPSPRLQRYESIGSVHREFAHVDRYSMVGVGFTPKAGITVDFENHSAPQYSCCYLFRGRGYYVEKNGTRHELHPGCTFQRLPDVPHSTYCDPDSNWLECWMVLDGHSHQQMETMGVFHDKRPVVYGQVDWSLVESVRNMVIRMRQSPERELPRLWAETVSIQTAMMQVQAPNAKESRNDRIVRQACQKLSEDLNERVHLEDIAQEFKISYSYFRRIFKHHMGISPGDYRIQRRLDHARDLLISTDAPIKDIAFELGYADPFTFSEQFKTFVGVSPSDFRG